MWDYPQVYKSATGLLDDGCNSFKMKNKISNNEGRIILALIALVVYCP